MEPNKGTPGMASGAYDGGSGGASEATGAAVKKRRGNIACRRCRRLRSRCLHQHSHPPCEACRLAGREAAIECSFPSRGERDVDRQYRRRLLPRADNPSGARYADAGARMRVNAANTLTSPPGGGSDRLSSEESSGFNRSIGYPNTVDRDSFLPPPDEVIEGCRVFVTSYFQLGFIPKAVFLENLSRNQSSVSPFLLACILSISARFTPSLVRRYGSARKATDHFLVASLSMVPAEMYKPSLERIQAFFLLAISQWGNGDRERSSMDMGVAVRMAALLKLHCEESYLVKSNSPAEQVVRSESARRVFWMIQSQENLHSGYKTPAPFPLEDITTLLPCDEVDFAFGAIPTERAAVSGTPPAIANPQLVVSPRRCLFATLIQAHGLWGQVSRRARRSEHAVNKAPPWDLTSDFQRTTAELRNWEETLPPKHAFSVWNLRGWRSESLHLAYLSVTMVLRLSNIVTRRVYLDDMLSMITNEPIDQLEPSTPTMANVNDKTSPSYPTPMSQSRETYSSPAPKGFWSQMANDLFGNVWQLHEQVDAYFNMRASDEGFPQILVFCVYMCGSLASYLYRYPALCPSMGERAEKMAQKSLEVLTELHAAWPTSSNWQKGLQQVATPLTGVSPVDVPASAQQANHHPNIIEVNTQPGGHGNSQNSLQMVPQGMEQRPVIHEGILGEMINVLPNGNNHLARFGNMQMHPMPNELFDAEMAAFLQGDFHYDLLDGWGQSEIVG